MARDCPDKDTVPKENIKYVGEIIVKYEIDLEDLEDTDTLAITLAEFVTKRDILLVIVPRRLKLKILLKNLRLLKNPRLSKNPRLLKNPRRIISAVFATSPVISLVTVPSKCAKVYWNSCIAVEEDLFPVVFAIAVSSPATSLANAKTKLFAVAVNNPVTRAVIVKTSLFATNASKLVISLLSALILLYAINVDKPVISNLNARPRLVENSTFIFFVCYE